MDGIKSISHTVEEKISELEDSNRKMKQNPEKRSYYKKSLSELWDNFKWPNVHSGLQGKKLT